MASVKTYRQSAEVLLGRPARSQSELDLINLRLQGSTTLKITGFETKGFRQACFPINRLIKEFPRNFLKFTCFSFGGTRGTDLTFASKIHKNIQNLYNVVLEIVQLIPICNSYKA